MAYKVCLALKTSLTFKLNHHQGQGIQLKPMLYVVCMNLDTYLFFYNLLIGRLPNAM